MTSRPPWIDERFRALPARPWRKVHLDFHNSQHILSIGKQFDADEFGDRLTEGHVDSIVVFAKDMHGYFYYPSDYGPVHPGLRFDLLGKQIEACRKRGITVSAYYCVTWDNFLAELHPEWLVWKRDRTTYLPTFDATPGWTALCLSDQDFVQLALDHSRELLERYELDGIWYDMPLPRGGECFCRNCLAALRGRGEDPFDASVQRQHKQNLLVDFMRRAYEQAQVIRPGCHVDQNNQTRLGLGGRALYMSNIDIEALPTASWGYMYFPTNARYARTFGTSVCGMSGRFHRAWADFGGLKHPNQLRSELPSIVANGAQCSIGDQMPPSGRLDPAVYQTIGQAYTEIEQQEPYLDRAAPVTEAAIVVAGNPLEDVGQAGESSIGAAVYGLAKLLIELHVQFDIVEPNADLARYRLLVLPDELLVDEQMATSLRAYVAGGGAILASHNALRVESTNTIWAENLGIAYRGESPFAPAYLKLGPALGEGLPDYEYALYDGAAQWEPTRPDVVLAQLGEPLFQRGPAHYTSHAQTPFDHLTEYAALVTEGRIGAAAFPLGASYYRHGYWIYREVFRRLLSRVLPERLVETSAPLSAEVTITHQAAGETHPARWMVHVVNFSPNRRSPEHCEYLEDPIPLRDVRISLHTGDAFTRAYLAHDGSPLQLRSVVGGSEVTLPEVQYGAIAVFE